MIEISGSDGALTLSLGGRPLLVHTPDVPAFSFARGAATIAMDRGNFDITDAPTDAVSPGWCRSIGGSRWELAHSADEAAIAVLTVEWIDGVDRLMVRSVDPSFNRITLRFAAAPDEAVWGGGEQMSYLMLTGRRFPMWTSEPGVGRDKSTEITRAMDVAG